MVQSSYKACCGFTDFFQSPVMPSADQCAVGPDGKLLDAKDITFYNDPDDNDPLPRSGSTSTPAGGQAVPITNFFPRTSGRQRKESSRLTDPNNAEAAKRKAISTLDADRRGARPRTSSPSTAPPSAAEDEDDDMPELEEVSDSSGEEDNGEDEASDTEAINAAYEHTKALGDADRAVCSLLTLVSTTQTLQASKSRPKADLTKDIQPFFEEDKVLDPDTGRIIKGHWCVLCKYVQSIVLLFAFPDYFFQERRCFKEEVFSPR